MCLTCRWIARILEGCSLPTSSFQHSSRLNGGHFWRRERQRPSAIVHNLSKRNVLFRLGRFPTTPSPPSLLPRAVHDVRRYFRMETRSMRSLPASGTSSSAQMCDRKQARSVSLCWLVVGQGCRTRALFNVLSFEGGRLQFLSGFLDFRQLDRAPCQF